MDEMWECQNCRANWSVRPVRLCMASFTVGGGESFLTSLFVLEKKLRNTLNFFYNPITFSPPEHAMPKLQELPELCQNNRWPSSRCLFCHGQSLLYVHAKV